MNRTGWAYGFTVTGSEWLTIVGSAHTTPQLRASREEAAAALDGTALRGWPLGKNEALSVAHVTEVWHGGVGGRGMAYRVTPGTDRREA
jgi:hypothetical protein